MDCAIVASGSTLGRSQQPQTAPPRDSPVSVTTKQKLVQLVKRPRASREEQRPSPAKKARSELAEQVDSSSNSDASEDELENDEDFSIDAVPAATTLQATTPHSDMIKDLQQRFEFQAVTQHYDSGDIDAFHSKQDLADECEELWARIKSRLITGRNWLVRNGHSSSKSQVIG